MLIINWLLLKHLLPYMLKKPYLQNHDIRYLIRIPLNNDCNPLSFLNKKPYNLPYN